MTEALRIIALQEAVSSAGEGAPSIELLARAQKFYDFLTADREPMERVPPSFAEVMQAMSAAVQKAKEAT